MVRKALASVVVGLWAFLDLFSNRHLGNHPQVESEYDRAYLPSEREYWLMDIHRPHNAVGPMPTIIAVHGGGLFGGDKGQDTAFCQQLAARGFAVLNINYRRTPRHSVRESIADVLAAIDCVANFSADLKVDPDRVFLVGESAGALLVCTISLALVDDNFRRSLELDSVSLFEGLGSEPHGEGQGDWAPAAFDGIRSKLGIRALGLVSPMLAIDERSYRGFGVNAINFGRAESEKRLKDALALENLPDLSQLPPIYGVSSRQDWLFKMSKAFVRRLQNDRAGHFFRFFGKPKTHRLDHIFSVFKPQYPQSQQVFDEMTAFFKKTEGRI
ncbi:MAG: alpha/beta hydrolase [Propionibacteriaceae bacterium]|jgi:acetyl esterase/lipase|nr:alpha/beta hydrolase [Propionibacteriaceae bacterium]